MKENNYKGAPLRFVNRMQVVLKHVCIYVFFLLPFFLLSSLSSAKADETLRLVFPEYPPYQYTENGKQKGFKLDILKEACRRAGYDLEVEFRPWARVLKMLETGQADFTNMYKTPEREKIYTFSKDVLLSITVRFFAHSDSNFTYNGNLRSLSDLRIGVINKISYGAEFDTALKDGLFPNIQYANNHENLVALLARKRVDLIVGAGYVLDSVIETKELTDLIKPVKPALSEANAYNAFTKTRDMRQVANDLDAALRGMRQDGTFANIIYRAFSPKTN